MTTYTVTFERIGRHRPDPLTTEAASISDLEDRILAYARPFLLSTLVDVFVESSGMAGSIVCGFQNGGHFKIRLAEYPTDPIPELSHG